MLSNVVAVFMVFVSFLIGCLVVALENLLEHSTCHLARLVLLPGYRSRAFFERCLDETGRLLEHAKSCTSTSSIHSVRLPDTYGDRRDRLI